MTTTSPDSMNSGALRPGLEGVVAAETRLSSVDGERGELIIAGFPVEMLAGVASFEETLHLLWTDTLPGRDPLEALRRALAARRTLSGAALELLQAAARAQVPVMDALRMAASTLSLPREEHRSGMDGEGEAGGDVGRLERELPQLLAAVGTGQRAALEEALTLVAAFPTLVAAYWRLLNGQAPIAPDASLGHAANYLYMLTGERPTAGRTRALETYLNTVVDHGLNASTFTTRVIVSTRSDLISAVVGGLGALKGPLHGGAPGPALDMVFEIGHPDRAEAWMRRKLEQGERLMGFGHRVYRVRDPRAEVLAVAAERLFEADGDASLYQLARAVERTALRLLAEHKPGRPLQTNVEFYTALLLHGLGLPTDLFTPTFAVSRVGGWTAHAFEQIQLGRLIRPQSRYVGPRDRQWLPLETRG